MRKIVPLYTSIYLGQKSKNSRVKREQIKDCLACAACVYISFTGPQFGETRLMPANRNNGDDLCQCYGSCLAPYIVEARTSGAITYLCNISPVPAHLQL